MLTQISRCTQEPAYPPSRASSKFPLLSAPSSQPAHPPGKAGEGQGSLMEAGEEMSERGGLVYQL